MYQSLSTVFISANKRSSGEKNLQQLSDIQARVLACLMEKKETTPDQYPLTTNSIRLACNQKSARNPVSNYNEGEVGHTLRELASMDMVREAWGARVSKYEHHAGKALGLNTKSLALLTPLILRGPQTLGELKNNSHRLFPFEDLDDILYMLKRLAEHEPPFVVPLPRQPGQKEGRYAHLLCGEPSIPEPSQTSASVVVRHELEERVSALESALAELTFRLDQLEPDEPDSSNGHG
jgi:uncharacterized protein YceH (UPF0502 family)